MLSLSLDSMKLRRCLVAIDHQCLLMIRLTKLKRLCYNHCLAGSANSLKCWQGMCKLLKFDIEMFTALSFQGVVSRSSVIVSRYVTICFVESVSYSCINNGLIVFYLRTFHLMSYWQTESYLFDLLK